MGTAPTITPVEYATWYTPPRALEALKELGAQTAVNTLLLRAKAGTMRTAAETVAWRLHGELKHASHVIIDPDEWAWANDVTDARFDFWKLGDVVFSQIANYGTVIEETTAQGVRFDPVEIDKIWATLGPHRVINTRVADFLGNTRIVPSASDLLPVTLRSHRRDPPYRAKRRVRSKGPTRVDDDSLGAWFREFAAKNADLYEREYVKAAKDHFMPLGVGRDRIRDLIRDLIRDFNLVKNRGKPPPRAR